MHSLLFIEDDDQIRLALSLALEDEGYTVDEAANGTEGLAAFAAAGPDLVLLDLRLPDSPGFDVCREIRAESIVPIIIVTAQTDTHDMVAGLEAGADDYVTKPVVPKELAARIRALLRRVQLPGPRRRGPPTFGDIELRRDQGDRPQAAARSSASPRPSSACCASSPTTPARCCRGTSCSSGCGATSTSATPASSTPTSAGCG